jgi:hypothetical protein
LYNFRTSPTIHAHTLINTSVLWNLKDKRKVEEKRENFSPRKLRKPGERERENFCWKVTFSRENFSPEKTLNRFSPGENIILHRTNTITMGPKLGGRPKNAIHTLYDKVTDKVEINF